MSVGLDLEVDGKKTLREIQTEIEGFKNRIFNIDSNIKTIDINIEPFIDKNNIILYEEELKKFINKITSESKILNDSHGIKVFNIPSGVYVSYHCKCDPKMSVNTAHKETALQERYLMNEFKIISRIYIYVEPSSSE